MKRRALGAREDLFFRKLRVGSRDFNFKIKPSLKSFFHRFKKLRRRVGKGISAKDGQGDLGNLSSRAKKPRLPQQNNIASRQIDAGIRIRGFGNRMPGKTPMPLSQKILDGVFRNREFLKSGVFYLGQETLQPILFRFFPAEPAADIERIDLKSAPEQGKNQGRAVEPAAG